MSLRFFVEEGCAVPTRADPGAAGYDLYTREDHVIEAGESKLMSTGVHVEVPQGHYARLAPRSGPASRWGLGVGAGVVDYGYTGDVKVLVFNHGKAPVQIKRDKAVAQLIVERIWVGEAEVVDDMSKLYDGTNKANTVTFRGDRGFSSSEYMAYANPSAEPAVV
jgi:dUTP pyrophosphatase